MKLGRIVMIGFFVGTLAVIGCNDEPSGTAGSGGSGTAGSGGTAGDVCVGGDCVDGSAEKMACEVGVTACRLTPVGQEACIQATVADNCNL